MNDSRSRVDYVPLLCIGLLVMVGAFALLFVGPKVSCPPCAGGGAVMAREGGGSYALFECSACSGDGRIRILDRLRWDLAPSSHWDAFRVTRLKGD